MRSRFTVVTLLLITATALFGAFAVNEDEYILKAGDVFLLQIISADTLNIESPVLPEGSVSIYPFDGPVKVAGLTLRQGRERITQAVSRHLPNSIITAELLTIAPTHIHVTGAVVKPGEYVTEEMITLYQALQLAEGLLPGASRKVRLIRQSKVVVYDLRKYLAEGDLTQNPVVQHDDLLQAVFAENAARVFVNNDTLNMVEYIELAPGESIPLRQVIGSLSDKTPWAEYDEANVVRDGVFESADADYQIMAGDSVFVAMRQGFVYVTGNVIYAGRYPYNAGSDLDYYLGQAGGINNSASRREVYVITSGGERREFGRYTLRPGDTIYVPEHLMWKISRYVSVFSVLASIVYTTIIIETELNK
ncbi:MAG: SLBB domain-containing protein [Candidatus Cloacimonetes bacterium]|nr:SLBB domain-containing protein [Candidatus Cloacimonadota bacterium]